MSVGVVTQHPTDHGCNFKTSKLTNSATHRATAGYTLVELLIGMVIVSLLAALAVPRMSTMRENAFVATMKSDLRNFSQAEESYFYDHAVYTSSMTNLEASGLQTSEQVTLTIAEATATGWAAIADHATSNVQCALFIGTAAPVGPATEQGRPDCS